MKLEITKTLTNTLLYNKEVHYASHLAKLKWEETLSGNQANKSIVE
jgi:hypothetical protein